MSLELRAGDLTSFTLGVPRRTEAKNNRESMRNNSRYLEECSEREINRGRNTEGCGERNTEKEYACESFPAVFHREPRTEALLWLLPTKHLAERRRRG